MIVGNIAGVTDTSGYAATLCTITCPSVVRVVDSVQVSAFTSSWVVTSPPIASSLLRDIIHTTSGVA